MSILYVVNKQIWFAEMNSTHLGNTWRALCVCMCMPPFLCTKDVSRFEWAWTTAVRVFCFLLEELYSIFILAHTIHLMFLASAMLLVRTTEGNRTKLENTDMDRWSSICEKENIRHCANNCEIAGATLEMCATGQQTRLKFSWTKQKAVGYAFPLGQWVTSVWK